MSLQLPDTIWSAEDLKALISELELYARWSAAASIKQRVATSATGSSEAPALSPAAVDILRTANSHAALTEASLDDLVAAAKQLLAAASVITITLAAPAPRSLQRSLVAWCRQNIQADMFVTFRFNATLLGGMVVQYGSHVYDWSFRQQILANRQKFPEVLRRV